MRQRAGAFQADHSRPHAAHRKGHAAEPFAGIFPISSRLRIDAGLAIEEFPPPMLLRPLRQRRADGGRQTGRKNFATVDLVEFVLAHVKNLLRVRISMLFSEMNVTYGQ